MGTLYIDRRDAALDYKNGQIQIHEPERGTHGYPLHGIERIVVTCNVNLQSRLLTHLAESGISIQFMSGRGPMRHASITTQNHGDNARRLGQYQLSLSAPDTLRCAKLLVRMRATRILKLYRRAYQTRPDLRHGLTTGAKQILDKIARLPTIGNLDSLRGIEGSIAAQHFTTYAHLFAESLGFNGRNRRPPRDPVNAALSLGYTITHGDALRAILTAGLDPQLGTLHEPTYNRDSLACDLNEIARTHVERLVWRLFADKTLRVEDFENTQGGVYLRKTARQAFYAAFEENANHHRREMRHVAHALARYCSQSYQRHTQQPHAH